MFCFILPEINSHYVHRLITNIEKNSFSLDKAEPDEDPEVTRAKYFIRDEFLVKIYFINKEIFIYMNMYLASQHGYR